MRNWSAKVCWKFRSNKTIGENFVWVRFDKRMMGVCRDLRPLYYRQPGWFCDGMASKLPFLKNEFMGGGAIVALIFSWLCFDVREKSEQKLSKSSHITMCAMCLVMVTIVRHKWYARVPLWQGVDIHIFGARVSLGAGCDGARTMLCAGEQQVAVLFYCATFSRIWNISCFPVFFYGAGQPQPKRMITW